MLCARDVFAARTDVAAGVGKLLLSFSPFPLPWHISICLLTRGAPHSPCETCGRQVCMGCMDQDLHCSVCVAAGALSDSDLDCNDSALFSPYSSSDPSSDENYKSSSSDNDDDDHHHKSINKTSTLRSFQCPNGGGTISLNVMFDSDDDVPLTGSRKLRKAKKKSSKEGVERTQKSKEAEQQRRRKKELRKKNGDDSDNELYLSDDDLRRFFQRESERKDRNTEVRLYAETHPVQKRM